MHICDVLIAHHGRLRQLFAMAEADIAAAETLIHELTVHHTMEEKFFYDFLVQPEASHEMALEHINEHHIIEMIIKDLDKFPREHEIFPIKIESLEEYTSHHLDEEEAEVFPMARQVFSDKMGEALGAKFEAATAILLSIQLPTSTDIPVEFETPSPEFLAAEADEAEAPAMEEEAAPAPTLATGLGIGSLRQ